MRRHGRPRTPLEDWLDGQPPPEDLRRIDQFADAHSGQSPDVVRAAIQAAGLRLPDPALDELVNRISRRDQPPPNAVRAQVRGRVLGPRRA